MAESDATVDIRCRGNSEELAKDIEIGLQKEAGLACPGGVKQLDRPEGAVLGAGTVIVTIIATALAEDLVKRGMDWLANKVASLWSQAKAKPELSVQLVVEVEEKIVS